MYSMYDDEYLISRINEGDLNAFNLLLDKYQNTVFNICFYMTGNREDSEDCTQETFIKIYNKINTFKPDASLYTRIRKIAVNTCLDYLKKTSRLRKIFSSKNERKTDDSEITNPEKIYLSKEADKILLQAMMKLPLKFRTVIVLRETEMLSYSEISKITGISEGTVKSRISRGRAELRKLLKNFREQK